MGSLTRSCRIEGKLIEMTFISRLLGPNSLPGGMRNFVKMRRDPLAFIDSLAQQGDIVYFRMGPYQTYLLNEPEAVRELLITHARKWVKGPLLQRAKPLLGNGLLTSEGELHTRQRRLVQPIFRRQRMMGYSEIMVDCALQYRHRWHDRQSVNMHDEIMRLTLAIVGKTLFGDDFERDTIGIADAVSNLLHTANVSEAPLGILLARLGIPNPAQQSLDRARSSLRGVIRRLLRERHASNVVRDDLLSLLMAAQDTEGDGGKMSEEQIFDECATLLIAGHETTANALTWTFYLLSQNPREELRMHAELDSVLAGRRPTFEDVPRLPYTEQVLAEAIRMYPPAWLMGRFLTEPVRIGKHDFARDDLLFVSPYTMQHDPRFYPNPHLFHPERFRPEAKASRPKFSYFPFGAGPRQCIGESFAWMEGTLVLATLAQRFTMRLSPGQRVEPEALLTLRPKHGMQMVLHDRKEAAPTQTAATPTG